MRNAPGPSRSDVPCRLTARRVTVEGLTVKRWGLAREGPRATGLPTARVSVRPAPDVPLAKEAWRKEAGLPQMTTGNAIVGDDPDARHALHVQVPEGVQAPATPRKILLVYA